jgi:uncharacterized protein
MLYRKMKGVDTPLSILGFGAMRLPVTNEGKIDEPLAISMIRYAIDNGVNYVDTAYPYHDGASEPLVGKALQDGYRDRTFIATKLPSWLITRQEDMDRILTEQLVRLQTDHIDFYLVHGSSQPLWENLSSLKVTEFLDDAIADGRIRHAAFSVHDTLPVFREIVDSYDWTFAQIQYNFMDENYQAGTEGLHYAAKKGLGVVVMEPVRGGLLAKEVPGITDAWHQAGKHRTPAEWALRWVWNHPEVTVVLSGMSAMEQVKENVAYAGAGLPGSLTAEDLAIVGQVRAKFQERIVIPCTGCRYCMPCPSGVNIPSAFEIYNQAHMFASKDESTHLYNFVNGGFFTGLPSFASCCQDCGACEGLCPQGLPIRQHLKKIADYFGK